MKFIEVLTHLLPGAEAWDEESLAEARACLEAAGPVFSDLLDEDGADSAATPTDTTSPVEAAPSQPPVAAAAADTVSGSTTPEAAPGEAPAA